MWYVIQTETGRESYVKQLIERTVAPDVYQELFIPRRRTMKRWRGEWRERIEPLVPGYLFVITGQVERLSADLRNVPALTKVLGTDNLFTPLSDEEVRVIDQFTEGKHRLVDMSQGVIEGDGVVVTSGPLMGQEALITRIDRHKRLAWVEIGILGRRKQVRLGLEIVRKA